MMQRRLHDRKQAIRDAEAAGAPRMLTERRALNRALRGGNEMWAVDGDSYAIDMLDDVLFETERYTFSSFERVVRQVVDRCNALMREGHEIMEVAMQTAPALSLPVLPNSTHSVIYYRRARPTPRGRIGAARTTLENKTHEEGARWVQRTMRGMPGARMVSVSYDGSSPETAHVTLFYHVEESSG